MSGGARRRALALLLLVLGARPAHAAGVIVVAGGGPEGEIGETDSWSYKLYKKLIENGDINGDGKIKAVVISNRPPSTNFMVDYLKSLGATTSQNLVIRSRKQAQDPKLVDAVASADVIFLRGGNQAEAYRNWKGTRLQKHIRKVTDSGGAIGGTSSGAMSLAGYALAGGQDLVAMDVLKDSHSPMLQDDKTGGSSIHPDFLGVVPGTIIDTHVGERARLGRLLGVHAKAVEDSGDRTLLAIGVEERTGIVIQDGKAHVYGTGSVQFIQRTPETASIRRPGQPLIYTDVRLDALTEGWVFDLKTRRPETEPASVGAQAIPRRRECGQTPASSPPAGEAAAAQVQTIRNSQSDADHPGGGEVRAQAHFQALQALHDNPDQVAVLSSGDARASSILLDCVACTHKSLSPWVANLDSGSGKLHSPGLVGVRVHVLPEVTGGGPRYDAHERSVKGLPRSSATAPDCDPAQSANEPLTERGSFERLVRQLEGCEL